MSRSALAISLALAVPLLVGCASPDSSAVRGVDVSHHQGRIDWAALKAQGVAFAYVKATEGGGWRDILYDENMADARAAGILTGSYHFFSFCKDGAAQARNFLAGAHLPAGDLIPVLDVESLGNCSEGPDPERLYREVDAFLDAVASAVGHRPIVYTTHAFHFLHMGPEFSGERFWVRNLFWRPGRGLNWVFWQHAVEGMKGVDGDIDQNVFAWGPERLGEFVLNARR